MDAPGFPEGPDSPTVKLLLWGLLAIMVIASIIVTVFAAHRRQSPGFVVGIGVGSLTLAIIAYFFLLLPSYVVHSPTGGGWCPIDAMDLAFMKGDKNTEFYSYWRPCRDASRRTIAIALAGYAVAAAAAALVQLRISKRSA